MEPRYLAGTPTFYLGDNTSITPTFLPGYDTYTVQTGPYSDVCHIRPCGDGVRGISVRISLQPSTSQYPPPRRRPSFSRRSDRSNYSQCSESSPCSNLPITAADYPSTVYPPKSQQRHSGAGQLLINPSHNVSRWKRPSSTPENRSEWRPSAKIFRQHSTGTVNTSPRRLRRKRTRFSEPQAQLSSHIPSIPTKVDDSVQNIIDEEPPLSPSPETGVTCHPSETLNADQRSTPPRGLLRFLEGKVARSRSSTSAVSAIIPTRGPLAAPVQSAQTIASSKSFDPLKAELLGSRPIRSEFPSLPGSNYKTRSIKSGFGDLYRNILRSVKGTTIGLRSRVGKACSHLRGTRCTSTRKQEEAYNFAAEESMMKEPLLAFMDEEEWEEPESEVPVLTLREDKEDWGENTRSAINTAQENIQL